MAPHPPGHEVEARCSKLILKPIHGDDLFKKAQPVSSPTVGKIHESQLVVGMPDALFTKVRCFQDKFAIDGIQGSLDEETGGGKSKAKVMSGVPNQVFVEDAIEERAAVEHDDDFENDPVFVKVKMTEDDISVKDTWDGVKHCVPLKNIPERCPVQVTDSSDSDTDEEAGPPSVTVIESSEEVATENAEQELPVQPLAKATKRLSQSRNISGKRKRKKNVYTVVIDAPPVKSKLKVNQPRRKKARWAPNSIRSTKEEEDIDTLIAEFCARDAGIASKVPCRRISVRGSHKGNNTPQDSMDSGLESGDFEQNDKGSSGGNSESNSGDSMSGGGGSSGGGGGQGGGGGGNGEDHEKDQESIMIVEDETSEEEDEDPSGEEMEEELDKQVPCCEVIDFDVCDLQHACYCRPGKPCRNNLCKMVKDMLDHVKAHHEFDTCPCCGTVCNVIKTHAGRCHLPGCRVPYCADIREGKITPAPVTPPGRAQPVYLWYRTPVSNSYMYETRTSSYFVDGQIIYKSQNADFINGTHFQEHIDYHVQRSGKVGQGSTGQVFKIITTPRLPLVVKQTMEAISLEELEIYRALGSHENIAEHYAVTYNGTEGKANIFMQEYVTSIYDYMGGRCLDLESAMYFWCQVLDGVVFLHDRPIPIVHKDIKAKNVLLCHEDTRAKLADFDSAKFVPDEVTRSGLPPKGTPGFAAPEVVLKQPHGTPADIHSFGCFLLEMTVGIPYNSTQKEQKLRQLALLDGDLASLVCACMDPLPQNRPTALQIKQCAVVKKYQTEAV